MQSFLSEYGKALKECATIDSLVANHALNLHMEFQSSAELQRNLGAETGAELARIVKWTKAQAIITGRRPESMATVELCLVPAADVADDLDDGDIRILVPVVALVVAESGIVDDEVLQ